MAKSGYMVAMDKSALGIRFAFVSKGAQDIIKLIAYDYVGLYHGTKTFNLGFGDYDIVTGRINDRANTENGDVYNVLNTVLNTIPRFFEEYPEYALMVRGSDTGNDFIRRCKPNCVKNCRDNECKNENRRINLYLRYVNVNYENLKKEYLFLGGNEDSVEPFQKDRKYGTVFVLKKYYI